MATELELPNGIRALTWSVLPEDREAIRQGYERLSEASRYHRFLAAVPHLTELRDADNKLHHQKRTA